jgi:ankyrin repeat protein
VLCDHEGWSALHAVAHFSESLEVLQSVLQIDHSLTKKRVNGPYDDLETTPLGLLCGRSEFPSFHKMLSCLIEVDSTVEVICIGVIQCMQQYKESSYQDILPRSRGDNTLILLGKLIDANADVANHDNCTIFHWACSCLREELGIAVLFLFLSKNNEGIKSVSDGWLPIHFAADGSSLDVMKFLLKIYPESLTMVTSDQDNLLHLVCENNSNIADAKAIVEFLCKLCPALVHMKCSRGQTPLHNALMISGELTTESVKILCNIDESVLRDKCTPSATTSSLSQRLALYLLIACKPPRTGLSDEGDCFRLFLQLYPASAGVKDGYLKTPYDLAVSKGLSVYFIRLLLNIDPTIDPVKRHNLMRHEERGCFLPSGHCVLLLSQQYGLKYAMSIETYFNESFHICNCTG